MNLRDQISADISRAIDSSNNYSGKEEEQNKHNWIQITTDRIVAAVMNSLPDPVDVPSKYEIQAGQTLPVTLIDPDEDDSGWNQGQLDHLTKFSRDNGYNRYYFEYTEYLKGLYSAPQPVLQSEHDTSEDRTQQEDSNESDDQEPSKVR